MVRAGRQTALLCLALATAGCGAAPAPPVELSGLWSAGDPSCEAGIGVRFTSGAIEAVYDRETQVLFDRPHYERVGNGENFKVRIEYELTRMPGGARSAGAYGTVVLVRQNEGIAPESHSLIEPRTGTTRMRIAEDPVEDLLTLVPCDLSHPWRAGLRGRRSA